MYVKFYRVAIPHGGLGTENGWVIKIRFSNVSPSHTVGLEHLKEV